MIDLGPSLLHRKTTYRLRRKGTRCGRRRPEPLMLLLSLCAVVVSGCSSGSSTSSGGSGAALAAAAPVISPGAQSFTLPVSVTITDSTPGALIYYTTDGSQPTTDASIYTRPVVVTATETVQAMAVASGFRSSPIASASFTYVAPAGPVADNFDESTLNASLWQTENPVRDGVVNMNGTAATLNLPQGTAHDPWTAGNNSLRITQAIANSDFGVEVRFDSGLLLAGQEQGLLVEQDANTFLRVGLLFDGSATRLFAAGLNGANATTFIDSPFSAGAPVWLRLSRSADTWTASWSLDGTSFAPAPAFKYAMNAAFVGPFAGNSAGPDGTIPAFTATVDSFYTAGDSMAEKAPPKHFTSVTIDPNPPSAIVEKTLADIRGTGHLNPVIGLESPSGGIYWYDYSGVREPGRRLGEVPRHHHGQRL